MTRLRPADCRFRQKEGVIWQCKLNTDAFSKNQPNLRAQSHSSSADIYSAAPNFLSAPPAHDDWHGNRAAKIPPPFFQDERISRLEGCVDQLVRKRFLEDKLRLLAKCRRGFRIIIADA